MAESISGLKRSHRCAEVTTNEIGSEVTLMGWVQKRRNLGSLIFVDLRDRSGLMQVVFDEPVIGSEGFEKAGTLRNEFVIAITGKVQKRTAAVNEKLATGEIEVIAESLRILSEADTPPFPIEEDSKTKDELRLKYRYLDLRRPDLMSKLMLRSRAVASVRHFLEEEGFIEVETPILQKSTPEGARDYLVPSRIHPGSFYALPQSPQLFKQLLMVSGFDRYYQIAKCFRDEDLRADRQPEFTQIDLEMSFVEQDDVIDVTERLIARTFKETLGVDVQVPIPRMTWKEAMNRFGSDKPDMRFGMELCDISEVVKSCGFGVFTGAIEDGGSVRCITVPGMGGIARKKLDKLTEEAKGMGAKGLSYITIGEDGAIVKCSFAKFVTEEEQAAIAKAAGAGANDLILIAADRDKIVWEVLGSLRCSLAAELGLYDEKEFKFLWVTDFPVFEWSDEQGRYLAMHHPFTMPAEEDIDIINTDKKGEARSIAYDIVLNGTELGGGSVRIHRDDVQEKMFEALGFTPEQAHERFGFLLDAFRYGVPPHAGLAIGLDRMIMLMTGADSIRDVIAFPKVKDASDLLTDCPAPVDAKQLEELYISVTEDED